MRLFRRTSTAPLFWAITLTGCLTPEQEPLPQWDGEPTDTDTDTDDPADLDLIRVSIPVGIDYPIRLRETGTVDAPCEIKPNGTMEGYVEMSCTIDMNELDLWGNGIDWVVSVSEGACEHVTYNHYVYQAWPLGFGPTEVTVDIVNDNYIDDLDGTSFNGVPYCQYDHTKLNPEAPNCCLGNYLFTINNLDLGTVSQALLGWGGRRGDCYDGAGYIDPEATFDTITGLPTDKILYIHQEAWTKQFHFDGYSNEYGTNLPLANYYDPVDHGGGKPPGLDHDINYPSTSPLYDNDPAIYNFDCWDHASEHLGHIELIIREFNEEVEFFADGNPDTVGTEPVTGEPIDDLIDWKTSINTVGDYVGFYQ